MRVLPMASDETVVSTVPEKNPERDILVVGRVAPSKRVGDSIKAASILRGKGWKGSSTLLVRSSHRYAESLRSLSRELDLVTSFISMGV